MDYFKSKVTLLMIVAAIVGVAVVISPYLSNRANDKATANCRVLEHIIEQFHIMTVTNTQYRLDCST